MLWAKTIESLVARIGAHFVLVYSMGAFATAFSQGFGPSEHHSGLSQIVRSTMPSTVLRAPSTNDRNDIVFRDGNAAVVLMFVPGSAGQEGTYNSLPLPPAIGSFSGLFPTINDNQMVATAVTFSSGNVGNVRRYQFNTASGTYEALQATADWDVANQTRPFKAAVQFTSINDSDHVAFFSEPTNPFPNSIRGVYDGAGYIADPTSAAVATTENSFLSIGNFFVDSSNKGWVFTGETSLDGAGVYFVENTPQKPITPIGTTSTLFTSTGSRPAVNNDGTVAFAGSYLGNPEQVYLKFQGRLPVSSNTHGVVPASILSFNKIAINDLNQAAYLGTNSDSQQAIFSNNLGATREIVSVGELLVPGDQNSTIQSLQLFDGINDDGRLIYKAVTADGQAKIVVSNRAYTQLSLANSPVDVPWQDRGYLLRNVPGSGWANEPGKRFRDFGCNLTTTVNVLNYYGADVTPLEFQNWLIDQWALVGGNAHPSAASRYITTSDNDFQHDIVKEFSQALFNEGRIDQIVQWKGNKTIVGVSNEQLLSSELGAGRSVKLQVPNGRSCANCDMGHFILAYGLKDSTVTQFDSSNVLIHDPGHSVRPGGQSINTLEDYDLLIGQSGQATWLTDGKGRVHRFEAYSAQGPVPNAAYLSGHSPIELLLTDELGRKLGVDPSIGIFNEIPGGQYFTTDPYLALDSDDFVSYTEPIKQLLIEDLVPGAYTLEIIGIGDGAYDVSQSGWIPPNANTDLLFGTITNGERLNIDFVVLDEITCDFSGNGICDIDDIDALVMEIAAMSNNTMFDLNSDGFVDLLDRDDWLAEAGMMNLASTNPYLVADFNLDGVVDGQDFIIWNGSKFTNTGKWSMGDANADGVTDGQDFIEWNANKFLSADDVAAVPEPKTSGLVVLTSVLLVLLRRL